MNLQDYCQNYIDGTPKSERISHIYDLCFYVLGGYNYDEEEETQLRLFFKI